MRMDLFHLTRHLIDIESVTGHELAIGVFLEAYLAEHGYRVRRQEVQLDRFNVYAFVQSPRLIFSTHLDTVPPFIASHEDDVNIYGRGACDAKGIIAAQIHAAAELRQQGIEDIGLLFVVGEEGDSDGAKLANQLELGSAFLINGEPTGNKLAIASKGSMRVQITTRGRAAHSAYPQMGESAIEKLLDVLNDIRRMPLPRHDLLGETNFNIGMIAGGIAPNVIADEAHAWLMFRLVEDAAALKAELLAVVQGRADVQIRSETPPVFLRSADEFETCVVSFTTDVPWLTNLGQPYLLGPGSILDAHTDHEKVSKQELTEAVALYVRLAKGLLQ
ncbi:MAG: M20/M25/M40 family metallo-hydrolase [Blastocatellia bacterium]|nr:M20/M25/M40 family metallo-hydrolase [Blastocatellia bacterium]